MKRIVLYSLLSCLALVAGNNPVKAQTKPPEAYIETQPPSNDMIVNNYKNLNLGSLKGFSVVGIHMEKEGDLCDYNKQYTSYK